MSGHLLKKFSCFKKGFFLWILWNLRNSFLTEQLQMTTSVERNYRRVFRLLSMMGVLPKIWKKSSFKKIERVLNTPLNYHRISHHAILLGWSARRWQKTKFAITVFFKKCNQICRELKNSMENFISCAMRLIIKLLCKYKKIVS